MKKKSLIVLLKLYDPMKVWRTSIIIPHKYISVFEAITEDSDLTFSSFLPAETEIESEDLWHFSIYGDELDRRISFNKLLTQKCLDMGLVAPDITSEVLNKEDWDIKNYDLPLVFAGRFVVHGDHLVPPVGRIALAINAGNAFGSGMHESTKGCLLALDNIAKKHTIYSALDVGSGSGILSVAVAKAWTGEPRGKATVLAIDIDPAAVIASKTAAQNNNIVDRMDSFQSDGLEDQRILDRAPYDLICANILANPLCDMASQIASHLNSSGIALLSGLLISQKEQVIKKYNEVGLRYEYNISIGNWVTLLFSH